MPPYKKKPPEAKCVACGGSGKNSKGGLCLPCVGTGRLKPMEVVKPYESRKPVKSKRR